MATVLIWLGSGFAFSIGVFVGAWLMRLARSRTDSVDERILEHNRLGHETNVGILQERNAIGRCQCEMLERIAEAFKKQGIDQ